MSSDKPLTTPIRLILRISSRDYDIGLTCVELCVKDSLECTISCGTDSMCISDCLREELICADFCPCNIECLDGCSDCDNKICQCNVSQIIIPGSRTCIIGTTGKF